MSEEEQYNLVNLRGEVCKMNLYLALIDNNLINSNVQRHAVKT